MNPAYTSRVVRQTDRDGRVGRDAHGTADPSLSVVQVPNVFHFVRHRLTIMEQCLLVPRGGYG